MVCLSSLLLPSLRFSSFSLTVPLAAPRTQRFGSMISGGLNYVSSAPAFSKDGKRLLVCSGTSVSVFSTTTGSLVSSLQGHTALVTAVVVVPTTASLLCCCWTASVDGTIRQWDYSVPECLRILDLRLPIFSLVTYSFVNSYCLFRI